MKYKYLIKAFLSTVLYFAVASLANAEPLHNKLGSFQPADESCKKDNYCIFVRFNPLTDSGTNYLAITGIESGNYNGHVIHNDTETYYNSGELVDLIFEDVETKHPATDFSFQLVNANGQAIKNCAVSHSVLMPGEIDTFTINQTAAGYTCSVN